MPITLFNVNKNDFFKNNGNFSLMKINFTSSCVLMFVITFLMLINNVIVFAAEEKSNQSNSSDILGVYSDEIKSFDEPPYFSPMMIYDFAGLPSDGADEVLISSVDLISTFTSERYYHSNAKEVFINGKKWVYAENEYDWVRYCAEEIDIGMWAIQLVSGPKDGRLSFRDNLLISITINERLEWHSNISRMRPISYVSLNCEGKLPFDFFESDLALKDVLSETDGSSSTLGKIHDENGNGLTKLAAQHPEFVAEMIALLNDGKDILENHTIELPEDINDLTKLAESGDITAQLALADKFYSGKGVSQSSSNSLFWSNKAIEGGSIRALYNNGLMYLYGAPDLEIDFEKAYNYFTKAAEQGHREAFEYLSLVEDGSFEKWENIPTDFNLKVFEAAGESGNSLGYFHLAEYYFYGNNGNEVPDFKKGFEFFLKAANLNHMPAKHMVGECYENGKGVLKNVEAAEKWYLEAANENNPNSAFRLGLMYSNGVLGKINKIEAAKWNLKAASQGHVFAMFNYGLSCFVDHDNDLLGYENEDKRNLAALYWFEKAGSNGHLRSQNMASTMHLHYYDNKEYSLAWALLAKDQGDSTFLDVLFADIDINDELMQEAESLKSKLIVYASGEEIVGTKPDYNFLVGSSNTNVFKLDP